jgi:hypothetical protein
MARNYTKAYTIDQFTAGDVVTVKLPRGTRTSTDNKKIFAQVLSVQKPNRYKLQTQYGVIERLLPTKELERVPLSMGIVVNRPSTKIALSKAALEASTSDQAVVSCKCRGLCNKKRCRCFKEQKKCTIHCHGGDEDHDCGFLASLALRTEKAIVTRKRAWANTAGDVLE